MKTNITIASNIYNRINDEIRHDPDFVSHVIGRPALTKLKTQYGGTLCGVTLSSWQESMYSKDTGCSYARNGEMTHGLIRKDKTLVWEGRCEYTQCDRFSSCTQTAHFMRTAEKSMPVATSANPPLSYEWLGNIDDLFLLQDVYEQTPQDIVPIEAVIEDIKEFVLHDEYTKIDDPSSIIMAPINSNILVNAAPGSGKTYTVIRRLEYIIRNNILDDFSSILVLVYTNAAKNEITNRLKLGVFDGSLPYSAKNVDVCTFDSLATSYLSTIEAQFSHLDYNGRIRLFNDKFNKSDFSNFNYVIVDELQDLVNERAKMTLNILSAITGGYLLLGDKCQAIYDYDCHEGDSVSSVEFYNKLGEILPIDALKYELTGNRRQSEELAKRSDDMRCALLCFEPYEANELIREELLGIPVKDDVERFDFDKITKKTAVLCRNNGEAEYVSHMLHKKKVPHTLLRRVEQTASFSRWISDCLWDYRADSRITRAVFIERYCARVEDNYDIASSAFDALSELIYDDIKDFIDIGKLASALCRPTTQFPTMLLNESKALLTVSTIHKAKGREFDTVYILDSGFNTDDNITEEARVWYVGCTRAKNELYKLSKASRGIKRSNINNARWMRLNYHRVKWSQQLYTHCLNVVIGLPKDTSVSGFVEGSFPQALNMQQYISESVHVGDDVGILLHNGKYQVSHKGKVIGYLGSDMLQQLREIAQESNPYSEAPPYLSPVYVSNIITITPNQFPDGVPVYFRETKFWLGVELTGFPKIDWHYSQMQPISTNGWANNPYSDWSALK